MAIVQDQRRIIVEREGETAQAQISSGIQTQVMDFQLCFWLPKCESSNLSSGYTVVVLIPLAGVLADAVGCRGESSHLFKIFPRLATITSDSELHAKGCPCPVGQDNEQSRQAFAVQKDRRPKE